MVCGIAGLALLARVDFPVIRGSGIGAIAALIELLLAAALLSAALGLVVHHRREHPRG